MEDKIYETDLYKPVHDYLTDRGYTVRGEVAHCDLTAVKGEELVVVELKRSFNLELLLQGVNRQRAADTVYLAIPRPRGGIHTPRWRDITHLLRRLELGLMLVSLSGSEACRVEIALDPVPFDRERSIKQAKKKRTAILREAAARYQDHNVGGSTRRKLMTAYRENAIQIACCLALHGKLSPKKLRELGTGKKTYTILHKNVYGWFDHTAKGVYALTGAGMLALEEYRELADHYSEALQNSREEQQIQEKE